MYNTVPCKTSKLYDDDDVQLALYPSPLSLTSSADNSCTKDVKMVIMWMVPTAV